MKRECTREEKEIIIKNKGDLLKGSFIDINTNSIAALMVGLFLGIALFFGLLMLTLFYIEPLLPRSYRLGKFEITLLVLASVALCQWIARIITRKIKIKKSKNKLNTVPSLYINGATIVKVDNKNAKLYLVEDDEKYIIEQYLTSKDSKSIESYQRVILIYGLAKNPNTFN